MTARRQALWLLVLCVTLHVLGWPRGARAHDTLEDRLELDARSAVITLRVASSLATVLATVTASLPQGPGRTPREGAFLSEGELVAAAREHATYLEGHLSFEVGGRPARARAVATTLAPPFARPVHTRADARSQLVVVDMVVGDATSARVGARKLRLTSSMLLDVDTKGHGVTHVYVVRATTALGESTDIARAGEALTIDLATPRSATRLFWEFATLGARHVAFGVDHLLFVVAITLGARSLGRLAIFVFAFTAAHALSLTLVATGLFLPSGRVIEPLIGASIALAALASGDARRARASDVMVPALLAFAFGLVHGLAFAEGLREALAGDRDALVGSVLAFTLGVEVVQQLLAVVTFGAAAQARRRAPRALAAARALLVVLGVAFAARALWGK